MLPGILAVLSVMTVYAINFVGARYSVRHGLTSLDLAALRYSVSGLVLLPNFIRLGVRDLGGLGWPRAVALSCFAGSPYVLTFFLGLTFAPASHGAVLNPGIVPSVVFVGLVALGREPFSVARAVTLLVIVLGLVLVTGSSFSLRGPVLAGDALLFLTGISWGLFTLFARVWAVRPLQAATIVSVLSMIYLPIYFGFFYHGFASVSVLHIVSQAAFQGLLMSFAAMYLLTFAVHRLGAQLTSLFSPLIPVMTTLLAVPVLAEVPTAVQWIGVALVGLGMVTDWRLSS
jgi:drug/metabolite transporter (DMT)-like permease